MMSSILSTTVYEYFENHKEDNPARQNGVMADKIDIAMPFSFRED